MRKLHCLLMGNLLPVRHRLLSPFRSHFPHAAQSNFLLLRSTTHKEINNLLPGRFRMLSGSPDKVCVTQC